MSDLSVTDLIDLKVQQQTDMADMQAVLMKLGRAQAFNFAAKLLTVSELKILDEVKKSKKYKGITLYSPDGKLLTISTWEDVCKLIIGESRQHVDERILNLRHFGEQFFETAQKIGLAYKDLRAVRQMSEEDQTRIIESEAAESGDIDALKEMIDELKAKHAKEEDKLSQELLATEAQLRVSRNATTEKQNEIIELKGKLEQQKFDPQRWKGEARQFFEQLAKTQNELREGFGKLISLSEQLDTVNMDDKTHEAAQSALYADSKILLTQLAHVWNELYRSYGHLDDAKPSGEWLAKLGFEGTEVLE
ncbi:hypothetical protein L1285_20890 [Pseudoalteromonas sp. DL2-H2.2]|uniref:hypothetical protein n=1 Tax=Pseudoalteromonas sp. DL2-H2.2 TaxID=2908889 RepID=UPI001F33B41A|nr:hypothetical protein [Pseudoalteromonas sp. DL2-H2.2]MCF2910768.1 hypothetical protein [Pseudoalteromonas sp. DL2-H2.2]